MKRMSKPATTLAALGALLLAGTLALSGCGAISTTAQDAPSEEAAATAVGFELEGYDLTYTDRDKDPSYDEESAVAITLSDSGIEAGEGVEVDGATATITSEGVYVVSGTLSDGQLVVDADDAKVQIVLNDASITNSSGPAIYVAQANKVFITLADGSDNYVADASGYELTDPDDGSSEPEGAVFSKDDLTLQGSGSLTVAGNCKHGIVSKDDLVITGGSYTIAAAEDALYGNNCVKIADGSFDIECGEDALKANVDDEDGKGFVLIDGGTFSIAAGDDAVHAETALVVNGGTVNVTSCVEGYEGQTVYINGGDSTIVASDDCINATSGSTSGGEATSMADTGMTYMGGQLGGGMMETDESCLLQINGGVLTLDAGGDGLDSNGYLEMTGGEVYLSGPTSGGDGSLDYGASASISGGTIIAAGSTGMAESFVEGEQAFALVSAAGSAGDTIVVLDEDGNELASMTASESFQCVVVSVDGMEPGTYQLSIGGSTVSFEASTEGSGAIGMGGMAGGGPGGQMQQAPGSGQPQGGMRP